MYVQVTIEWEPKEEGIKHIYSRISTVMADSNLNTEAFIAYGVVKSLLSSMVVDRGMYPNGGRSLAGRTFRSVTYKKP